MYPLFGRYSDSYKTVYKNELWWNSIKLFENKKYFDAYESFFNYLRDDEFDNVRFNRTGDEIKFQLQQGSKLIKGIISDRKFSAESCIAEFEKPAVSFMRRLMELNYKLYYSRFAIKDNLICIKFDTSLTDCHPYKLYRALRELAVNSDRQDDLLVKNFPALKLIKDAKINSLPEDKLKIKYKYFTKWIDEALTITSKLNEDTFRGAISYVLLNTIYKIDYLISPEGTLMEEIEKASLQYFLQDNRTHQEKNREIKNTLVKFINTPEETIIKDFTIASYTFGLPSPAKHDSLLDVISKNIPNAKYYNENNLPEISLHVLEYIVSFSLFTYSLPKPDVNLLELVLNIVNQDYFSEMGYGDTLYKSNNGSFKNRKIKKDVHKIIDEGSKEYPRLKLNTDNLKFSSMTDFMTSYIQELTQLNFNQ